MPKRTNDRLQGTLDLLILKIVARTGRQHGYAIAQRIHLATEESLRIEEGSLYPALQRMTHEKWLRAQWARPTLVGRSFRSARADGIQIASANSLSSIANQ